VFKINNIPVQVERYPDKTPRLNIAADSDDVTIEWLYEKDEEMLLFFIAKHLK